MSEIQRSEINIKVCFRCGKRENLIPALLMTRQAPPFPFSNFVSIDICEECLTKLEKSKKITKDAERILRGLK